MKQLATVGLTVLLTCSTSLADLIEVRIPGTNLATMVNGTANYNAGGTVTVRHSLGRLYFGNNDILKKHKVQPLTTQFNQRLGKAKDAAGAMQAARWALKHGLLDQFITGTKKALEFDSQYADALRVAGVYRNMAVKLGDHSAEEKHLRQVVRRPNMEIATSDHFILLHDTPKNPPPPISDLHRRRKSRSEERLELLENVYKVFLYKFYSQGVELEMPKERLKVVLFNEERDFYDFATSLDPELRSALGFYDPRLNISFFFDNGSSERMKPLRTAAKTLQSKLEVARKRKDKNFVRAAETITLLVEIDRENADIEVVSHEATHQLAGNTGLLPRHVLVPSWLHEGLATYFEAPDEATWSGMGAVNGERIGWYRGLAADRVHSNLDFIVGDQIFKNARSQTAVLHGYGQAWALTHFLMEKHFDKFMAFYRRVGEMPPDIILSPRVLNNLFDDVFKTDRRTLDAQWRSYMRSLKTDLEIILAE